MRLSLMAVAVDRLQVVTVATAAAGQVGLLLVVQLMVQVTQVARDPVVLLRLAVQRIMAVQVVLPVALVAEHRAALQVLLRAEVVADRSLTKTSTTRLSLGPQAAVAVVVVTQPVRLFHQQAQAPALFCRIRLVLRGQMPVPVVQVPLAS